MFKGKSYLFILFAIVLLITYMWSKDIQAECTDEYAPYACVTCFDTFDDIMSHLRDQRSQNIRVVQLRNGRDTPMTVHSQYFNACFFFAIAPIIEYLGYSAFEHLGSFDVWMRYMNREGLQGYSLDAGYYGSPEHLIAKYFTYDTIYRGLWGGEGTDIYPCGFFADEPTIRCSPEDEIRLALNDDDLSCHSIGSYIIFNPGEEYGVCNDITNHFPAFLNRVSSGCNNWGECLCAPDASCGMFWFMNRVLPEYTRIAGANDARRIYGNSYSNRQNARRIIKTFVENNMPLLVSVNRGGHYMTLVGWADLDEHGLPRYGIVADSVRKVYWKVDLLNWNENQRYSLDTIYPWNQHLNRGCESGGWAQELDSHLSASCQVCSNVVGTTEMEADPYYGIGLTFVNDEREYVNYHKSVDDPFISESRNIYCDRVALRYVDGVNEVTYARIRRYWFNSDLNQWSVVSSYAPDELQHTPPMMGRQGTQNIIQWDRIWSDNGLVVANGLPGRYTKWRTAIELRLSSGNTKWIEIAPPETYGIRVECINDGRVVARYFSEAEHDTFKMSHAVNDKFVVFNEDRNLSCDSILVTMNLGYGTYVADAEIERQYYGSAGRWLKANSSAPWDPDRENNIFNGLTRTTKEFVWERAWPENYWLSARNVGSGSSLGDRKTVIRLKNSVGTILRTIEIVPF